MTPLEILNAVVLILAFLATLGAPLVLIAVALASDELMRWAMGIGEER